MNSIKCKNCGLKNFTADVECRRCGLSFVRPTEKRRDQSPRGFSLMTPLMIALAAGVFYYFYSGVQNSVEEVNANEAKRVASQPAARPGTQGLSRTEYDRQKAGTYGDAVKNSPGLNAHQQRVNQTERAVQEI